MKVNIEAESEYEARRIVKSLDLALCIFELENKLRAALKHGDNSFEFDEGLEKAQSLLIEAKEEYGINLEDLIT